MDEVAPEYDVVVLGTGLTECVLSGVMSVKGKKVLHIDRNDHYGGESASLNIEALFKRYGNYTQGEEPWKKYGRVNDWNVDLVPKLLMSNGELTNILVSTDVTRYLEFKQIAGSYVQQGSGTRATVAKVPSDAGEALRSPLMGLFEKRRAKRFLEWVGAFKEDDPSTYGGLDLNRCTMKEVYDKFGLEATTRDFIGHSMALYQTDEYINQKGAAKETVVRIRLYANSMARYGKSPYIYPLYGLGELPQGFARLSAIYGGTYMLNTIIDEFEYEGGKVSGIKATMRERSEDSDGMKFSTRTKKIIADPSYFPGKVQVVAHLLKAICILTHPVANTENSDSAQLIIPQSQVGRRNDIYIAIVSSAHNVCPKGYYIAIVSTIAEGSSNHHLELQPGFDRLGKIEEKFMGAPIPLYEPLESGRNDNIFISKSYDATSHFETTTDDVRDIYRRAEQEELVVEGLREGDNLVGQDISSPSSGSVPGLDPGSSSSLVSIGDGIEHSLDRSISIVMPLSSDCPYEDFPGVVRFKEIDDEITVYVGEKERKFKISKTRPGRPMVQTTKSNY
ncbi:MAG: Rab GDP dissociation inhibitor alpha [Alectoria sarmentosa]|nr:MAG: Rab GDP dissociation inhibitor alpha [Alectoria sarmentosa]